MKKFSIFAPRNAKNGTPCNAKNGTHGAPNGGIAVADLKMSARTKGLTDKIFLSSGAASKVSFSTPGAAGTISSAIGAAKNGKYFVPTRAADRMFPTRGATGCKKFAPTRGATIEYAVVFMVIVTVFIALILTLGMQSAKLSDRYNAYTDEKLLLDEIGAAATSAYQGKTESQISDSAPDLSALYVEKLTPYGWSVEQTATAASGEEPAVRTVTVKKGDGVRLLVRFTEQSDGTYLLTQYTYGD